MANVTFDIGTAIPVVLERWEQTKNASGSLTDVLTRRYSAFANVDNVKGARSYEDRQLKESDVFNIIVRKKVLEGSQVNVLWKVVFRGRRHTVLSKKVLNKKSSDFLLTVEAK